jgi:hypothetical protein
VLGSLALALLFASKPPKDGPRIVKSTPPQAGIPVASVSLIGGVAEQSADSKEWRRIEEGFRLKTGDRLRTGTGVVARIEFPWLVVTAGPATQVRVPPDIVLSTVLEEGRVELFSRAGSEIVKLRVASVEIRGGGHLVVRREGQTTRISAIAGGFHIFGGRKVMPLNGGDGAIVDDGEAPKPVPLSQAPSRLVPGIDPAYVGTGKPLAFTWEPAQGPVHFQLLALASEEVLMETDVDASPHSLRIPWTGTFRWRVARRDAHGVEGFPSQVGFVCVVDE